MNELNIVYFDDRKKWRDWLNNNFEKSNEVWLVFPKISSNEKGITYNDAVEEALCFGWIDGKAGTLDDIHLIRRFTPRKNNKYSQPNIERLIWLESNNLIHPKIKPSIETIINTPYIFPNDIIDVLKKDNEVWQNFKSFTESYKRIRIAYIDSARKRPNEFNKRLINFINKTRENKLIIGYGGIDKYYK